MCSLQCCTGCLTLTRETFQTVGWLRGLGLFALVVYLSGVIALGAWALPTAPGAVFAVAVLLLLASAIAVVGAPIAVLMYYCFQTMSAPHFIMPCARKADAATDHLTSFSEESE
jgi:hypothetical protein